MHWHRETMLQLDGDGTDHPHHPRKVMAACCSIFSVTVSQMMSDSRHADVTKARMLWAVAANRFCRMSYPESSHAIGRKNHSGLQEAGARLLADPATCAAQLAAVRELINQTGA